MKNTFIYRSEGKQKQNKAIYFTKHRFSAFVVFFHLFLFFELSSVIHYFKVYSVLDF